MEPTEMQSSQTPSKEPHNNCEELLQRLVSEPSHGPTLAALSKALVDIRSAVLQKYVPLTELCERIDLFACACACVDRLFATGKDRAITLIKALLATAAAVHSCACEDLKGPLSRKLIETSLSPTLMRIIPELTAADPSSWDEVAMFMKNLPEVAYAIETSSTSASVVLLCSFISSQHGYYAAIDRCPSLQPTVFPGSLALALLPAAASLAFTTHCLLPALLVPWDAALASTVADSLTAAAAASGISPPRQAPWGVRSTASLALDSWGVSCASDTQEQCQRTQFQIPNSAMGCGTLVQASTLVSCLAMTGDSGAQKHVATDIPLLQALSAAAARGLAALSPTVADAATTVRTESGVLPLSPLVSLVELAQYLGEERPRNDDCAFFWNALLSCASDGSLQTCMQGLGTDAHGASCENAAAAGLAGLKPGRRSCAVAEVIADACEWARAVALNVSHGEAVSAAAAGAEALPCSSPSSPVQQPDPPSDGELGWVLFRFPLSQPAESLDFLTRLASAPRPLVRAPTALEELTARALLGDNLLSEYVLWSVRVPIRRLPLSEADAQGPYCRVQQFGHQLTASGITSSIDSLPRSSEEKKNRGTGWDAVPPREWLKFAREVLRLLSRLPFVALEVVFQSEGPCSSECKASSSCCTKPHYAPRVETWLRSVLPSRPQLPARTSELEYALSAVRHPQGLRIAPPAPEDSLRERGVCVVSSSASHIVLQRLRSSLVAIILVATPPETSLLRSLDGSPALTFLLSMKPGSARASAASAVPLQAMLAGSRVSDRQMRDRVENTRSHVAAANGYPQRLSMREELPQVGLTVSGVELSGSLRSGSESTGVSEPLLPTSTSTIACLGRNHPAWWAMDAAAVLYDCAEQRMFISAQSNMLAVLLRRTRLSNSDLLYDDLNFDSGEQLTLERKDTGESGVVTLPAELASVDNSVVQEGSSCLAWQGGAVPVLSLWGKRINPRERAHDVKLGIIVTYRSCPALETQPSFSRTRLALTIDHSSRMVVRSQGSNVKMGINSEERAFLIDYPSDFSSRSSLLCPMVSSNVIAADSLILPCRFHAHKLTF